MTRTLPLLPLLACALHAGPVLLDPPARFSPPVETGALATIQYLGQAAKDGRIDLTATNGFFDRCFEAADPGPALPGDDGLINASFGHLQKGAQDHGTARWHLWFPDPGEVRATFHLTVPATEAGHRWTIQLGGQSQTLTQTASDPSQAQLQTLTFTLADAGRHTFSIDCSENPPPSGTRIHFITLEGSAIDGAKLLRTRWRPAASHQGFTAPESCTASDIWVFESEAATPASSYSPITTPFGYFGTGFTNEGKISLGASYNFSMWLAGHTATSAPPIDQMPFIFATGIADADFETFHHEGTGVKLRNAVAYPDGADRVIQAMRLSFENGRYIFYGYYFDESESRWKLFAAGSKPHPANRREPDPTRGLLRRTGSFVEIPGPPARERSGDVVRIVRRRGWFIDRDLNAHRAIMEGPRGGIAAARRQVLLDLAAGNTEKAYTLKFSHYLDDFARNGWMATRAGGIDHHLAMAMPRDPAEVPRARSVRLPDYLQPAKLAELTRLPVTFGKPKVNNLTQNSATIDYPIEATGPNSRAILYYGPVDALTYPPREIKRGSPALREMFSPERTWRHATPPTTTTTGSNSFQLTNLKPATTYHFRLYVEHDEGKCWALQSGSFSTP